jgi:hypothetical protein
MAREFFRLVGSSSCRRGAHNLFHGFCLDKTFDCSVDHRIDPLLHGKFILNDVLREKRRVSSNQCPCGLVEAKTFRCRQQNRAHFILDRTNPFRSSLKLPLWEVSAQMIGISGSKCLEREIEFGAVSTK